LASHVTGDDRHMPPCPATGWDGISWTFPQADLEPKILLISASQAARIISVSN
jgi:hypothetical protein